METTLQIEFSYEKLKSDKERNKRLDEFVHAVCALFNTNGGRITLHSGDETECYSDENLDHITKRIEQKLFSLFGMITVKKNFRLEHMSDTELCFDVEAWPSWRQPCTVNYNLYYPSETQVIQVLSSEPLEEVIDIIEGKSRTFENNAVIGHHHRHFVFGEPVALRESKNTQLKKLNDDKSTKCNLASRMTNKSNKLTYYVSAFANCEGGHIYYGIKTEEGTNIVEGERVEDEEKIIKAVKKLLEIKMWWCEEECGAPERGRHWDIFFERVLEVGGSDSRFVIVISVAPSPRGVFAEKPESYHVVDGEVKRLDHSEWSRRLRQHRISDRLSVVEIQTSVGRCSWSSSRAKTMHEEMIDKLVQYRNDGDKQEFERYSTQLQERQDCTCNTKIIIQQQECAYLFREGFLEKAEHKLEENKPLQRKSPDASIYEFRTLYWLCVIKRSLGKLQESVELFTGAVQSEELTQSMLIGPWLFVHKAKVLEIDIAGRCDSEETSTLLKECRESLLEALRRASILRDSRASVVELKQRVHIQLARSFLGFLLYRDKLIPRKLCTESDRLQADKMLEIVDRSCNSQGWPMTRFCKCEYLVVRSMQAIRNWEQFRDPIYLKSAHSKCKKALKIAKEKNFKSILSNAKALLNYVEDLSQSSR